MCKAEKLIDFDSDFEYVNTPIQRVEEEDINDHFDRCESILSDMESISTNSKKSISSRPKSQKSHVGMETIKRQMDSLTEMVNDLQNQMEIRDKPKVRFVIRFFKKMASLFHLQSFY